MASDGLFPAYFQLHYDTAYFTDHVMTRAIRAVSGGALGNFGTVTTWTDDILDTDVMIDTFVAAWLAYQGDGTTATFYDVFMLDEPEGVPIFLGSKEVADPGLIAAPTGRAAAVQHQMFFKSAAGGKFFINSLDRPSADFYGSKTTLGAQETTFKNYIITGDHALAGMDGGQPLAFRRLNVGLNDRLMRSYGKNF